MNIKKIIAREGLFLLIAIGGGIFLSLETYYKNLVFQITDSMQTMGNLPALINTRHEYLMKCLLFHKIGFWLLVVYFLSTLFRFVLWAIRTLKQ